MEQEDLDGDDVGDVCDNCIEKYNTNQVDSDGDGKGNVCDQYPEDYDNDTIDDSDDNCPLAENPGQEDTYPPQGNGIGDACECEADLNCDGGVNVKDVEFFLRDFKKRTRLNNPCTNKNPCVGDFDCDGDVDDVDKTLFQSDFGRGKHNNPCPDHERGMWCVYE
jgi:hypothetical protein